MFDGFWSGLFGGLFGPALAQWMSRFKFWVIFLVTVLAVHFTAFILDCFDTDFLNALNKSIKFALTPAGILAPMGIGVLAVFVAFIGSLNAPPKKISEAESEKK